MVSEGNRNVYGRHAKLSATFKCCAPVDIGARTFCTCLLLPRWCPKDRAVHLGSTTSSRLDDADNGCCAAHPTCR